MQREEAAFFRFRNVTFRNRWFLPYRAQRGRFRDSARQDGSDPSSRQWKVGARLNGTPCSQSLIQALTILFLLLLNCFSEVESQVAQTGVTSLYS